MVEGYPAPRRDFGFCRRHAHLLLALPQNGLRLALLSPLLKSVRERGHQSTWQERAQASEQEARQLRRDLAAQERFQQALQQQLDEERKAREELARQVSQLLKPRQQKGKGHE